MNDIRLINRLTRRTAATALAIGCLPTHSAWCRCKDTADLAFAQHTVWPALNSVFNDRVLSPNQTQAVRKALAAVPTQQFEVWVTHQVNITALTGQGIGMGEIFILDGQGTLLARTRLM